ncbi:hypothetical protein [Nitrospira sp. Nam74]
MSACYTPVVPGLGIPAIQRREASMDVTTSGYRPHDKGAKAFPASILAGASFNPELAPGGSTTIGREPWLRGFNVQLADSMNFTRDGATGAISSTPPKNLPTAPSSAPKLSTAYGLPMAKPELSQRTTKR